MLARISDDTLLLPFKHSLRLSLVSLLASHICLCFAALKIEKWLPHCACRQSPSFRYPTSRQCRIFPRESPWSYIPAAHVNRNQEEIKRGETRIRVTTVITFVLVVNPCVSGRATKSIQVQKVESKKGMAKKSHLLNLVLDPSLK